MRGYNFTDGVRTVLAHAREEAARFNHEYVGTEHMLLGIVKRGDGAAIRMLDELDVDPQRLRTKLEETLMRGNGPQAAGRDLPYTSRARVVLELAMTVAREHAHSYVGSEHLLLGLLREKKGIAAQVLLDAGVTEAAAREAMLEVLGAYAESRGALQADVHMPASRIPALVVVEVRYDGGWTLRREFRTAEEAMAFLAGR